MRSKPYTRGTKSKRYYIDYKQLQPDGSTKVIKQCTDATDYQTACDILKTRQAEYAKAKHLIVDPLECLRDRYARLPFSESYDDYKTFVLTSKPNGSKDYHDGIARHLRLFAEFISDKPLGQTFAQDAVNWSAHLMRKRKVARTIHDHLGTIKRYTNWLYRNDRVMKDPFAGVQRPSPKEGQVKFRRPLTQEEWKQITSVLTEGAPVFWMDPKERKLLYHLAIRTGLRVSELRSLRVKDFVLTGRDPHVLCTKTKNKKPAKQFLGKGLAKNFADLFADKRKKVWKSEPPKKRYAEMLRKDMEFAYDQIEGALPHSEFLETEGFDFHCLRHTCGAWLVSSGQNIKVVQRVMRHASIQMTLDTYGHLMPEELSNAIHATEGLF